MDHHKLPAVKRSDRWHEEYRELAGDVATYLPHTISKQAAKREQQTLEETRLRLLLMKAGAVLEKLAVDYRLAARRYALLRLLEEADYYVSLLDKPRAKEAKNLAMQIVQQFTDDLYRTIVEIAQNADQQTLAVLRLELYPKDEEERSWLQSVGLFLG